MFDPATLTGTSTALLETGFALNVLEQFLDLVIDFDVDAFLKNFRDVVCRLGVLLEDGEHRPKASKELAKLNAEIERHCVSLEALIHTASTTAIVLPAQEDPIFAEFQAKDILSVRTMGKELERMFTVLLDKITANANATIPNDESESGFPNRSRFKLPAPALASDLSNIPLASRLATRQPRYLASGPGSGIHCIARKGHGHEMFFLHAPIDAETGDLPSHLTVYRVQDGSVVKQIPSSTFQRPNALFSSIAPHPDHELLWFYTFMRGTDGTTLEICAYHTQSWEMHAAFSTQLGGYEAPAFCKSAMSKDGTRMAIGFNSCAIVWTRDEKGGWTSVGTPLHIDTKDLNIQKLHFSSRPGEHHLLFVSGVRYSQWDGFNLPVWTWDCRSGQRVASLECNHWRLKWQVISSLGVSMQVGWLGDDKLVACDKELVISDLRTKTRQPLTSITPRKFQFLLPKARQLDVWENSQGRFVAVRMVVRRNLKRPLELITDVWNIDKGERVQSFKTLHTLPLTEQWTTNLLLCGPADSNRRSVWQLRDSPEQRPQMVHDATFDWSCASTSR